MTTRGGYQPRYISVHDTSQLRVLKALRAGPLELFQLQERIGKDAAVGALARLARKGWVERVNGDEWQLASKGHDVVRKG